MTNAETNHKAATVAEQAAHVAPAKAPSKKGASQKKGAPRAKKSAKPAKAAKVPRAAKKGASEAPANKKAEVIAMMKRAKGVTLAEIVATTGWQKHTVRGFVSILGGKGGQKIESSKNAAGERSYRIAK